MSNLALSNPGASAWYELGVKGCDTLTIKIHRLAMAHLQDPKWQLQRITDHFQQKFQLEPFVRFSESGWGFGSCFRRSEDALDDGWLAFDCELPIAYQEKGEVDMRKVYAVRSTLCIVFDLLWLFEGETGVDQKQLMVVDAVRVDVEMHGGALCVGLTLAMCHWLSRQPDSIHLTEVEQFGYDVDRHLCRTERVLESVGLHFRVLCRQPRWLNISVPGNACGLDPDSYDEWSDKGYTLCPHNVDSSIQQLTLLMMLAKIHDMVRANS